MSPCESDVRFIGQQNGDGRPVNDPPIVARDLKLTGLATAHRFTTDIVSNGKAFSINVFATRDSSCILL
jgi:hypothetical protein